MDNLKNFGNAAQLKIQVDGDGGGSAPYGSDLVSALSAVLSGLGSQYAQMPEEQRPSELLLEFCLTALPEGGYAIGLDSSQRSFKVLAKWGGDASSGLFPQIPR